VVLRGGAAIYFSGTAGHAAWCDFSAIGLSAAVAKKISAELCEWIQTTAAIPADRVFTKFSDVAAAHWGWNGTTFG